MLPALNDTTILPVGIKIHKISVTMLSANSSDKGGMFHLKFLSDLYHSYTI